MKHGALNQNKVSFAIIIAALIIGIFLYAALKPSTTGMATFETSSVEDFDGLKMVTKIIDGDTIVVEGEHVRLLGMDTDERGYPCYSQAKERLEEMILNKEVRLEKDQTDKDQYQRYLRYIFLNNENINLKLVSEGFAVARFYPEDTKYKPEIVDAERQAREAKVGCKWGREEQTKTEQPRAEQQAKTEQKSVDADEKEWNKLTSQDTGLDVIGACNAGNYIGEEKIVEGRIVDTYKYQATSIFLNFEKPYPNSCFTVIIWSSDWYKFPENAEEYYYGKTVRIKGNIIEYNGASEIILKDLSQIEVG